MSNPTSNFGWQMPQSTDLVTDLPADFEVFGQAVDTDFVDLLGGTTGQVLSKTSGTDLDFTWVTANPGDITGVTAGTGISGGGTSGTVTVTNDMATTITAAGDIVVGTGSGTYDNLPIGTTAQVLTADTTISPYKVKWATPAGGGGMTLLSTTTLSGTSTTISSIDGTYVNLVIFLSGITNGTQSSYRTIEPNAANNISTYQQTVGASGVGSQTQQSIYMNDTTYYMLNTNADNAFAFTIYDYASTTAMKPFSLVGRYVSSDSTNRASWANGGIATTSAITSIKILQTTGSFTAGTVKIYGVK